MFVIIMVGPIKINIVSGYNCEEGKDNRLLDFKLILSVVFSYYAGLIHPVSSVVWYGFIMIWEAGHIC